MRSLLLLLLCLIGCEAPQAFEENLSMASNRDRYPKIAPVRPAGIPEVANTIPREGMWSGYNQLGYEAKYGPDKRKTQTILKLDEWGHPEIWTVSLFVKQKFTDFNGFSIRARINFGAGGSTQVYECDWLNGSQISLPMNAVNVEAIFSDVDVTTEGAGLSLGVQLSRGSRGGTKPPIFTLAETITINAGASSPVFDLPHFAKRVVAIPADDSGAGLAAFFTANVLLITASGEGLGSIQTGVSNGAHPEGGAIALPIVGSARDVHVDNGSGAAIIISIYAELDG